MGPRETPSSLALLPLPGLSGPSIEDSIGLFLSAFLLLGLIKALGWMGKCEPAPKDISRLLREVSHTPSFPCHSHPSPSAFPIAAYLTIHKDSKAKVTAASLDSKVTAPGSGSFPPHAAFLHGGTLAAGVAGSHGCRFHTDLV